MALRSILEFQESMLDEGLVGTGFGGMEIERLEGCCWLGVRIGTHTDPP